MFIAGKIYKFQIFGHEAFILNGRMEVSVPSEEEGTKILMKVAGSILDRKLSSLRINMPNKIIFVEPKDKNHITVRAEDSKSKLMN